MKKVIKVISIILLSSLQGFASGTPDSLVAQGNKAYNEARYKQAAEYYQSVIDKGLASAGLYYNLGNAYFKLNDIPAAILYYEKALKLEPKDDDINFNLNLANSRIIDKIEPLPEFFLKKWWKQMVDLLSPGHWAWTGIALFIGFLILLGIFFISRSVIIRKVTFWAGIILLLISLFSFFAGFRANQELRNEHEGIIFTPTVTVKSSPTENSVDLFVIHEGTKVHLLDTLEDWTEIRIANGSVGWIRVDDYQAI